MFNRLLALLFPERCLLCDDILPFRKEETFLCENCMKSTTILEHGSTCSLCGTPSEEKLCSSCLTHRHFFDKAISCFAYKDQVRSRILQFKFGGRRDLYRGFAFRLARRIRPFALSEPFDIITCVPMTKAAKKERGYNQTALLATAISHRLNIPFAKTLFIKKKETPKQSTLSYSERWQNVSRAFALSREIALNSKRVLVIDDVLTTGATADALARLLKSAGAKYVFIGTIATTIEPLADTITLKDEEAVTY